MRGSWQIRRVFLALAIGMGPQAMLRAGAGSDESAPGYQLGSAELSAITAAVGQELPAPGTARFSDVTARQSPAPSRSINVCGFVETGAAPDGPAIKLPFMASISRSPEAPAASEAPRVTVVGVGDPEDVGRSYTICKVCEESNLPICP